MKTLRALSVSVIVSVTLTWGVTAQAVQLPTDQDTTIRSDQPDDSQPTLEIMIPKFENTVGNRRVALARFDLSGLTFEPTAATLMLREEFINGHVAHIEFYPLLTDWDENASWNGAKPGSGMTWSAGTFSSADYGPSLGEWLSPYDGPGQPPGYNMQVDITALVQDWYNGAAPNYGIAILTTGGWFPQANIATRETAGDFPPMIDAVPEPATMLMLGLGAAALLRRHRKVI